MKSCLCICTAGLALLAVPATASPTGITYDCDTAANHFSELDLPSLGVPFTVSGNVQLNALAGSTTYAPTARVWIASPAEPGHSPEAFAGFSLGALPADAAKTPSGAPAVQMLSFNSKGKEDEVIPLSLMGKPGSVQPFTLSYDGNNVVVALGQESKTIPLKTAAPVVTIVCSTGEFLFTNLTMSPSR